MDEDLKGNEIMRYQAMHPLMHTCHYALICRTGTIVVPSYFINVSGCRSANRMKYSNDLMHWISSTDVTRATNVN